MQQGRIRRFKLSEQFINQYKDEDPPWGPVGYVTYKRTYARRLDEYEPGSEGTEEWYQTCRRVIEGMFTLQKRHVVASGLPWNDAKAQRTAKEAYERLFTGKWTPPGRGLWMMGTDFVEERTGAGLFNCGFRSTKDLKDKGGYLFSWMMDALMVGIGVGFDTLGANTTMVLAPQFTNDVHVIPDSREGWVETVQIIIDGFIFGKEIPVFDFSEIRAAGERIRGFGGISAGPNPLKELHWQLGVVLGSRINKTIRSSDIVDISNLIGRCVVAGNVRRSAELALGQADDHEFVLLKQNDLLRDHHRWCSNNSIVASIGMNYDWHAQQSMVNGEPGYIWLDTARTRGRLKDAPRDDDLNVMGFNPCVEQQLEDGELCCLTETFPARHDSYEDWLRSLKIAYMYAKTVTLATTQWPDTNQKMLRNRRIGLSMTGFIQACNKFGRREMFNWCDNGYEYVQELDKVYSDWLCTPRSRRTTSIKPSGTVSKLFGATPGCHYPENEYYIQRIRFEANSDLIPQLQKAGYHTEPCVYSPNTTVVEFPIKEPHFVKSKADVSMWEQLEIAAQLQHYWADNSVSVTVTFKPEEAEHIKTALEMYETRLKAVSFLRYKETGYKQAPMEPITQQQYEEMSRDIVPITRFTTSEEGAGSKFCTTDHCEIDWSQFSSA